MKETNHYRTKERDIMFKVSLGTGLKDYQIKDAFMFWAYELFVAWQEGDTAVLPYIGEVRFEYTGDVEKKEGRQATGKIHIELCDEFLKMIGQCVDGEKSDFERKVDRRLRTALASKL